MLARSPQTHTESNPNLNLFMLCVRSGGAAKIDVDHSGSIDLNEFKELVQQLTAPRAPPKDARLSKLFEEADIDHSGYVNFEEFVELYQRIKRGELKSYGLQRVGSFLGGLGASMRKLGSTSNLPSTPKAPIAATTSTTASTPNATPTPPRPPTTPLSSAGPPSPLRPLPSPLSALSGTAGAGVGGGSSGVEVGQGSVGQQPPPVRPGDLCCREGNKLYCAKRHVEAYGKYLEAAEQGSVDAMMMVARMVTESHHGVETKPNLARRWLRRAVDLGSVPAKLELGSLLVEDMKLPLGRPAREHRAFIEAESLLRSAAAEGAVGAATKLGSLHESVGNLVEAAGFYRQAVNHGGDGAAANSLGVLLFQGKHGVVSDQSEAARLFKLSADGTYSCSFFTGYPKPDNLFFIFENLQLATLKQLTTWPCVTNMVTEWTETETLPPFTIVPLLRCVRLRVCVLR